VRVWRTIPSGGNRRALMERGDADISFDLPPKDFSEMKQEGKLKMISNPIGNGIYSIEMNVVNPPFNNDKIRQAGSGMPAVLIRLLANISVVAMSTTSQSQRDVLLRQANMVLVDAQETVRDEHDLADVQVRYDRAYEALKEPDDFGV